MHNVQNGQAHFEKSAVFPSFRVSDHFGSFCIKGLKILKEQWKYSKVVNKTWSVSLKNGRVEKKQLAPFAVSFSLREKFPNTKFFWSVFLCIQTECWKIRTKKNSVFGHFSRSKFQCVFEYFVETGSSRINTRNVSIFSKITDKENSTMFFHFAQYTR